MQHHLTIHRIGQTSEWYPGGRSISGHMVIRTVLPEQTAHTTGSTLTELQEQSTHNWGARLPSTLLRRHPEKKSQRLGVVP